MKLTSMQKMLAVIALMAVVVIAGVALLIVPKFGEMSTLEAELQAANDQIAQTKGLLAQLEQAKANASVTQAELLAIGNQFPEKPELPALVIELQDVSNAAGIRFDNITPSMPAPTAGGQYSEVLITTSVTGAWPDVLDYLRRLNRMTRAIRVTDVAMTPLASVSTTSTEAPDIGASVSMRAYVMNAISQQPAAVQPAPAVGQ
ncbi:MAG: type 4a pilus biogenesis protein PilO [Coriobacteriia bacterium]|nr:type 4a pilus biogenesis protein PilO [Coriobacteriia bacterium]